MSWVRKNAGKICIVFGILCLLIGSCFWLYNTHENNIANQAPLEILPELKENILEYVEVKLKSNESLYVGETLDTEINDTQPALIQETIEIDGYSYIGYMSIPSIDIELPVQDTWSYPQLKISPCRYSGTVAQNNLVVVAHNYTRHFGLLHTLQAGDAVSFTDAAGERYDYEIGLIETLQPTAIEDVIHSNWDLTLVTCTYGGKSRVVVRCQRVADESLQNQQ